MKISIFILLFVGFISGLSAQQNLVPNHSFEEHNIQNEVDRLCWGTDTVAPWNCWLTVDLFVSTEPGAKIGHNNFGYQEPFDGLTMAGMRAFDLVEEEWHEFIYCQLEEPLEPGKTYFASMMLSPGERLNYATDDFGMSISGISPFEATNRTFFFNNYTSPQVKIRDRHVLTNDEQWYEVSSSFNAKGDEEFIVIGNHKLDAQTTKVDVADWYGNPGAYFFVDNIILRECPIPINVNFPDSVTLCGDRVYELDVTTPEATYFWSNDSREPEVTIRESGKYWVQVTAGGCRVSDTINVAIINDFTLGSDTVICNNKPIAFNPGYKNATYLWNDQNTDATFTTNQSGRYWVEIVDGDCFYQDTIDVNFIAQEVDLFPNPSDGVFSVLSTRPIDVYYLYDASGKLIREEEEYALPIIDFNISNASGIYFLKMETEGCTLVRKIAVIPD